MTRQRQAEIPQHTPEAKAIRNRWAAPSAPPEPSRSTYTSQDIADITGASLRQLQWWDEQGLIQPRHMGHRREYSAIQRLEAQVVKELRDKGYSLQAIRVVFRSISRTWQGKPVGLVIFENPGAYLLAMPKRGEVCIEVETVIQVCCDSTKPVVLIQLPGVRPLPPAKNGKTRIPRLRNRQRQGPGRHSTPVGQQHKKKKKAV